MSRLGVTTQDIVTALNEQNVVAPAGTIGGEPSPAGQQMTFTVTVHGRLSRAPRSTKTSCCAPARTARSCGLQDVARVELAATDYGRSSRLNGQPVALLGVYALPDANSLEVGRQRAR